MKPRPRLHLRALPMPLWIQGGVEALLAALAAAVLVLLVLGGVWLADGFADTSVDFIAQMAGQAWLALHGAPLRVTMDLPTVSAEPVTGIFWFLAWGLAVIPFWLGWRAGRRLGRASYTDQLWQALAGAAGMYALFSLITSLLVGNGMIGIDPLWGMLAPTVLHTVAVMAGVRHEAGSWGRLIGVDLAERISRRSQYSRWAGSYVWSVIRAAGVGLLAAFGLAAALLAVQLAVHWGEMAQVYQQLEAGVWGGAALTGIQLGVLPNLVMWTTAWTSGAGFALGQDTLVSPLATSVGPQPALPVLTAVPTEANAAGWLFLLLPVLAGVLAGWWLLREAENHLDEWLSLKIEARWLSLSLSTLALGLLVGAATALTALIPLLLSRGSLGVGRLTDLGPNPWVAALLLGAEIGVGAMIGYLAAPLWERYRYVVPESWLRQDSEDEDSTGTADASDEDDDVTPGAQDEEPTEGGDAPGGSSTLRHRLGERMRRLRRGHSAGEPEGSGEGADVVDSPEGDGVEDSATPSSEK